MREYRVHFRLAFAAGKTIGQASGPHDPQGRILLKADVSDAGEAWGHADIADVLDTTVRAVERTRRDLVVVTPPS